MGERGAHSIHPFAHSTVHPFPHLHVLLDYAQSLAEAFLSRLRLEPALPLMITATRVDGHSG